MPFFEPLQDSLLDMLGVLAPEAASLRAASSCFFVLSWATAHPPLSQQASQGAQPPTDKLLTLGPFSPLVFLEPCFVFRFPKNSFLESSHLSWEEVETVLYQALAVNSSREGA